jgi:hypothetical protein
MGTAGSDGKVGNRPRNADWPASFTKEEGASATRQNRTARLTAVSGGGPGNTKARSRSRDSGPEVGAEHRVRTGDLRLGNSQGPHSRTFPTLHAQPKPSISFEAVSRPDPRISHAATQKHESLGPTGVQENLLGVAEVARRLGVCTATIYSLCASGELVHVRILNAIRVAPTDLVSFIAIHRRCVSDHPPRT